MSFAFVDVYSKIVDRIISDGSSDEDAMVNLI
jgi:hypothetical protein